MISEQCLRIAKSQSLTAVLVFNFTRSPYEPLMKISALKGVVMRTNIISVMLTLAAVAAMVLAAATTTSMLTFAGGQKPSAANELAGTSWKLVKFQGGDETTLVPDDGSKYTITFGSNGRVSARVDCNRGSST